MVADPNEAQRLQQFLAASMASTDTNVNDVKEGDKIDVPPDLGVEMTWAEIKQAGYVVVYHTVDGDARLVHRNSLGTLFRKRLPKGGPKAGQPAFSIAPPPGVKPIVGTMKCMLHPSNPLRQEYDAMGLGRCNKANLRSPADVFAHMRTYHRRETAILEEQKSERQKAEDRELQRSTLKVLQALARSGINLKKEG